MSDEITLHLACQCGAHRYPLQVPKSTLPLPSWTCHCSICRHVTGAPFITRSSLPQLAPIFRGYEPPTFQGLPDGFSAYIMRDQGAWVFCSICGSSLAGVWKAESMGGAAQWAVSLGALYMGSNAQEDVYQALSQHFQCSATGDGGLARWLNQDGTFWCTWPGLDTFSMPAQVGHVKSHTDGKGREVRTAGCKCQGVKFEILRSGDLASEGKWDAHHCFCSDCRLSLGHLLPSFVSVDDDHITWLEKGTLKTYDSNLEKGTQRLFCSKCGASVGKRLASGSKLDVNLGMIELDGESEEGGNGEGLAGVLKEWTVWNGPRFLEETKIGRLGDEILMGMKRDGF